MAADTKQKIEIDVKSFTLVLEFTL